MARKRRWSRYQPPAERRDEAGGPADLPGPAPRPAARPKPTPRPQPKSQQKPATPAPGAPWVKPLVVLGIVVAVVVAIVVAVQAGGDDDGDGLGTVDTKLLDESFIRSGLADAREAEGERRPVAVHLDEYSMTVEYYDPAKDQTRYVERNSYSDGYTVRVENNFYSDYKPVPFDLAVADPARMVAAVHQVLEESEDPYTWEVKIRVEQGESTPRMVAHAGGKDSVDITSAP
ncbi:hypothetical protein [Nocardioides sp. LML1-1-1.1]|uniref:hypothetical protein n=1 Tax=Nocardioides sp. LML1-1-1.1 TaxID=3135248 RepID=UPI00344584BD